jgi:YVTN family beta-propeller protein
MLPYDIAAQTLHSQTLEEIVNPIDTSEENPHIDVGDSDRARSIDINSNRDKITDIITSIIYVTNSGSDSVSVISGDNNTKIKDIPVGSGPTDIAIDYNTNTI